MAASGVRWSVKRAAIWATVLANGVLADQMLVTSGFTNCNSDSSIFVDQASFKYNNNDKTMEFTMSGTSEKEQNVIVALSVTAYGHEVYNSRLNPCDTDTPVNALCPVASGKFVAESTQTVPEKYANQIPAIAFHMPDINAHATLRLLAYDNTEIGCIDSLVTNGQTADKPAVSYAAAGMAGAALLVGSASAAGSALSGAGAAGSAGGAGASMSPSFGETISVFQGIAMTGLMSVDMPQIYKSYTKNFAFATGIIPWMEMERSIDTFRNSTGGNLTRDSVDFLQQSSATSTNTKRALARSVSLFARDGDDSEFKEVISGIQKYVNQLKVPQSNVFMTILLVVLIIIAVIVVGVLMGKVILETWAMYGTFPESLSGFRKHYWRSMARTLTSLILLLYGMWVLYCIFQFTNGDSWAAKTLAGISLAVFTGVLAFFSWKIWKTAKQLQSTEGDTAALYENKENWIKYSMFYESYKKDFWWLFIPAIAYLFIKGAVLAATDGHGMAQASCLLFVEGAMLGLLAWSRPFERKSGNVVNIAIQTVRFLSVVCVFVFVEEFGVTETTKTVTGIVLIAIQSTLAGALAILIGYNAVVAFIKENPHRKRRKELEKMQRDLDTLTPLDARNSLLMMDRSKSDGSTTFSMAKVHPGYDSKEPLPDGYSHDPANPYSIPLDTKGFSRPMTPMDGDNGRESLIAHAAPPGRGGSGNKYE
ncbi:hypothetical protein F5X99DRAFT_87172 [Biscogniauxia marginata]|nr:hypothetical protein F5X99DRAFT_87172 [Biscogniauxia marginata]